MTHPTPVRHQTDYEPLQITVREAGRLLAYDTRTVSRLVARGELQAVGHGKLRRIITASVYAYQQRHLNGTSSATSNV